MYVQQHVATKHFLHSHLHQSPLTHRQEVSGYGSEDGRTSDTGDNWTVECATSNTKEWTRESQCSTATSAAYLYALSLSFLRRAVMHILTSDLCMNVHCVLSSSAT